MILSLNLMKSKNIALLAGGFSGEYEVSINSASNIAQHLNPQAYKVYTILISAIGWFYETEDGRSISIDKNDFSLTIGEEKIVFDAVFITVHGTPGEDGKLQGYFDLLRIPYNTCDTTTSAITMNKAYTKAIIHDIEGLHLAASRQLFRRDREEASKIIDKLIYPLFIKPNNGGSSVGMSKINKLEDLMGALEKAFLVDEQVLVEEFIKGREFSIGIVKLNNEIQVLPATEIISSKEFFDYEAKYTPGVTKEITPADLSEEKNRFIAKIVKQVYRQLNCRGMVRVDFILQENTNDFYFIEINTTPGQSENSLIPQQVRAAGILLGDFYAALIEGSIRQQTEGWKLD